MSHRPGKWPLLAPALGGFLACGLTLWPLDYADVSMGERPSFLLWLALGAIAGAIGGYTNPEGVRKPVAAVGLGFVGAVMVRVGFETMIDPTSHNLWPFELVISGGIGMLGGLIGVGAARLYRKVVN